MEKKARHRKRAEHTRSKQGCRVCRIRRVRCDQTRPACLKCTTTGRQCEGYPPLRNPCTTQALLPRGLPPSPSGDPRERRYLSYFQSHTAPQFSGPFENEFWSRLVLQVGASEVCVRQGIVALGSLHEAFQEEYSIISRQISSTGSARRVAYEYYAKAIGLLNVKIGESSWEALDVTLLSCILAVSFEWLRGHYRAAEIHMVSGLRVLRQWSERRGLGGGVSFSSPMGHLIRTHIAPVFTRMALQARTLADDVPIYWVPFKLLPDTIHTTGSPHSLKAARLDLDILLSQVYMPSANFVSDPPHFVLNKNTRASYARHLAKWYDDYNSHLYLPNASSDGAGAAPPTRPTISLTIWYVTLTIMLGASRSEDQMLYDAYFTHFLQINALAQLLSFPEPSPSTNPATRFSLDMETLPMLYLVASKCRNPFVRRTAISLLKVGACREGLWDGRAYARLAEEIVNVEEEGLEGVLSERDISGNRRVIKARENMDLDGRSMIVRFLRQGDKDWMPARTITW